MLEWILRKIDEYLVGGSLEIPKIQESRKVLGRSLQSVNLTNKVVGYRCSISGGVLDSEVKDVLLLM